MNYAEHLQSLEYIGSVSLSTVRQKLLSLSFQGAVWNLVNSIANHTPAIAVLTPEAIQCSLETVANKLQFVRCLHTRFLLLPKSVDITVLDKNSLMPECDNGFRHRTLYFVNQSKTCIIVAEPPTYISVLDVIAVIISHFLGCPMPLPIGPLFYCPESSETAIVDMLKLNSGKREIEAASNSSIGKEILAKDALQVQFHPLRPFYKGEIVAWRIQNGDKLKYGRVPDDVRPSAGQALYRFKVETAPGVIDSLLSSQVFSFRSMLMGDEASVATIAEDANAVPNNKSHDEIPESSRGKMTTSQVWALDQVVVIFMFLFDISFFPYSKLPSTSFTNPI